MKCRGWGKLTVLSMKKKKNLGGKRELYRDGEWSVRGRIFIGKLVRGSGDVCNRDKMAREGFGRKVGHESEFIDRDVGT